MSIPKSLFDELQTAQADLAKLQLDYGLKVSDLEGSVVEKEAQYQELSRQFKELSQDKHK